MSRLVAQSCLTLCDPVNCSPPGSSVHGIVQSRILGCVTMPSSKGSSQPRCLTQASCIEGRFFTNGATKEAQEYWSGFLLQGIFLTQELNWGLLHCRKIPSQLNYQGSLSHSLPIAILTSLGVDQCPVLVQRLF